MLASVQVDLTNIVSTLDPKRSLLVILSPCPDAPQNGLASQLEEWSSEPLTRKKEHLSEHVGFVKDTNQPFMMVSWNEFGLPPFDYRWLFRQSLARFQSLFATKELDILLLPRYSKLQTMLARDAMQFMSSTFPATLQPKSFRILSELSDEQAQSHFELNSFARQSQYQDWINENPDDLTSLAMVSRLHEFASRFDLDMTVFDEVRLHT